MTEYIAAYIKELNELYKTGLTTEHSFRPALQRLLQDCTSCTVINEQSHIDCGAPDLTLLSKQLPIAYIEAKDLEDGDLDGRKKNKEQFDRYKASLDTIIFTDYLDFHLYEHGEWQQSVRLAEIQGNKIRLSDADRFVSLMEHIKNARPQRITSASKLAQLMAGKARLLRDIIEQALIQDGETQTELRGYMQAFQQVLIHDITPKTFADIYAQTIAYGMFAARLHDNTPGDFSRAEAANLIPKTNPFLRKVFQQIAGYDLDERIAWIVDDLVSAFAATDMEKIMQGFGKSTQQTDPMLHFYEDFLFQYDPAAKKQCGVYYTPQPVVEFMVRAVDDILRTEFNLPMGLADTSKVEIEQEIEQDPKHRKEKKQVHRVQVLDPATGTGTFLAETVRQIKRDLGGQMGAWPSYVPEHLLPRLHGFELMMAPYTIAHLKLDMEIGIPAQQRLKVFLTNSLEEADKEAGTLFGNYLAQEANEASHIKQSAPVMIVMGNPPYSISSNNKGEWINHLLDDYKKNLNERNIQPLSDDYIKFIRLAQYYVERNGEGVLAYICNNSFIDGLIHRQMRSELLRVFDKIYILDLHGNTRKKETAPDGSKDENVFDIMQGVSINIFIKKSAKSKSPAEVRHFDLYGLREHKYDFLRTHNLASVDWQFLNPQEPQLFFVPKDFSLQSEYEKGFKVDELMPLNTSGVKTHHDEELVSYGVFESEYNQEYYYRPFDNRYINYDLKRVVRHRYEKIRHMLENNIGVVLMRKQQDAQNFSTILVTDSMSDLNFYGFQSYVFPLYLYPEPGSIDTSRRPNLDEKIWAQINTAIGKEASPEDIFDYIYGVLHSPAYRAKYKEFLKVDFPRIPYPKDKTEFEHFRSFGNQLRELHLMHNVPESPVTFPNAGSMQVDALRWEWNKDDGYSGNVYINETQCFEGVPAEAWDFYIGGYQPAQKWLKDRKGRTLSFDDIEHYRKIISVLIETSRLMKEIG
ncbi:MAG: N-6 DNA methylase [Paludibacteraceae bacterium]|nr:N-6 DNA methylase [Paludibacteraceae bacterium]